MTKLVGVKPKLVKIVVPYYQQLRAPAITLFEQLQAFDLPGYNIVWRRRAATVIHAARSEEALNLDAVPFDFLFFIDDDLGGRTREMWETHKVEHAGKTIELPMMLAYMKRILDHDLNICGASYHTKEPPYRPLVSKVVGEKDGQEITQTWLDYPDDGVDEVASLPGGFLCIKHSVLNTMADEFERRRRVVADFARLSKQAKDKIPSWMLPYLSIVKPALHPPFYVDYQWNPLMKKFDHVLEDVFFCQYARELGFKLYCDFSVKLGHQTEIFIREEHFKENFFEESLKIQQDGLREHGLLKEEKETVK